MYAFNSYKAIGISRAKFYCNRLATVQGVQQDYASLTFLHACIQF